MPALRCRYCGVVRYLSNSLCHASADNGGSVPVTGCHSTIERPDSVTRAPPPTSTMAAMSPAIPRSHRRIARKCGGAALPAGVIKLSACNKRRGPYRPARAAAIAAVSRPEVLIYMRMRARKLIGAVALLALVTAWALIAMAIAQFAFRSTNELAAWIYYVVAGLGWVLPAMPLISWMSRPDP